MAIRRQLAIFVVLLTCASGLWLSDGALGRGGDPDAPATAPPQAVASLTGQLLVASPDMQDPRFAHTVVLIVKHDKNGAFGIVINRPVEERPYSDLLKALGDTDTNVPGSVRIFAGGPVQPELGFIVHSAEYRRPETVAIDGKLAVTSTPDALRDLAHGHGPKKAIVAFGYAGWGPGQLDHEMALRGWFTAPADPDLVFDDDRATLWDTAMAHRTINL
ncbi:MAG TPA: YqgE/AlgH family protein [Alphaproteobacteria bacterium]|nr:YqgE/AlgH family protein [Alphaproteobacteria bacterium]